MLYFLLWITLWYFIWVPFSNDSSLTQYPIINKFNTWKEVRICNNTNTFFRSAKVSNEITFLDIPIWECSIYQEFSNDVLNIVPTVTTKEDEVFYRYETTHWDVVDWNKIPKWKYTVTINNLLKNEFKLIEYFRGVEFDVKKE